MTKIERELLMALAVANQIGRPEIRKLIARAEDEAKPQAKQTEVYKLEPKPAEKPAQISGNDYGGE